VVRGRAVTVGSRVGAAVVAVGLLAGTAQAITMGPVDARLDDVRLVSTVE